MKDRLVIIAAFAFAALQVAGVRAQEADDGAAAAPAAPTMSGQKPFHTLPYCRTAKDGRAEVLRPGSQEWESVKEGRYYALGTAFRTIGAGTELVVSLGKDVTVEINGEASFSTRAQPLDERSRTICLMSGTILVKAPRNFPDGLLVVSAPGFMTTNGRGDIRYTYSQASDGDGDVATVSSVTGEAVLSGRNFTIPVLKAASEVRIRTSRDVLFTGLYGVKGDNDVKLDQGRTIVRDMTTGENVEKEEPLVWKLFPKTAVRIHRSVPAVGDKWAVSVMTFDQVGELVNRCVFVENTVEVNSGEIGPIARKIREDLEKKAADAAGTTVDIDVAPEGEGGASAPAAAAFLLKLLCYN